MQNFCLSEAIIERFQKVENELGFSEHLIKMDCNTLDNWEFKSRNSFELGSIEDLAQSIKNKGQCQPIIVVKTSKTFRPQYHVMAEYVVIAGYRRWLACKSLNIKVEAIIKEISYEQAIVLAAADNEKEDVSDFSKGLYYASILAQKNMTELKLSKSLNIKLSELNNYLAFAKVPSDIWEAVKDVTLVPSSSAAMILAISKKGSIYRDALRANAKHIAKGANATRIQTLVQRYIDKMAEATSKCKKLQHQVKFDGKIIVNLNKGRIKLDKALVNHGHYEELISKLENDVIEFVNAYLKPK